MRGKPAYARFLRWAGVDRPIALSISARMWGLISGPVTMLLIAARFSKEVQGYYFTFSSLLALQVFLELGLGQVIVQFASHEWSHLGLDSTGRIAGSPAAMSRLGDRPLGLSLVCCRRVADHRPECWVRHFRSPRRSDDRLMAPGLLWFDRATWPYSRWFLLRAESTGRIYLPVRRSDPTKLSASGPQSCWDYSSDGRLPPASS